jgi:hypothetical protein
MRDRASERWTKGSHYRSDPVYVERARDAITRLYRFFTSTTTVHYAVGGWSHGPSAWVRGLPTPRTLDRIEDALKVVEQIFGVIGDEKLSGWCVAMRWDRETDPKGKKLLAAIRRDPARFVATLPTFRSHHLPSLTAKYELSPARRT